jgi:hypothetical protein
LYFSHLLPAEEVPEIIQDIIEQVAENSEDGTDFGALEDNLQLYAEHRINLNMATKEELEQLFFLSAIQIENLLYYLYRYGPMLSIYELKLIEGFDMETIVNLLPFVVLEQGNAKNRFDLPYLLTHGKHVVYTQTRYTVEKKAGYTLNGDEQDGKPGEEYLGEPFYLMLRYNFQSKNRLLVGFSVEKDEGEPLINKQHYGFDFYSAHLQLNRVGLFKRIIVGDYRASFGYGLVINNGFSMGKSSYALHVLPANKGLNKTSSANELNFLRGVGTTLKFGKFEASYFYSYKRIDASLVDGNGIFTSLKNDGLHRTASDWEKRKSITQQVIGTNVSFLHHRFRVGITAIGTRFNCSWQPERALYNLHYFRGKEQVTGSIDYCYYGKRMRIYGETALEVNKSLATLNVFSFNPTSRIAFVALQRYYPASYGAIFANSFSEGSTIGNEHGIYMGTEILPVKYWKLFSYVDVFRFPWLKYGVDKPSGGYDMLFQVNYTPKQDLTMYVRYRHKQKEKNSSYLESVTNVIEKYDKSALKYVVDYRINEMLGFKNTIETNRFKVYSQEATLGFYMAQDICFSFQKIGLKIDVRYAFFDAEFYDNRFYEYEKDVLHAFSVPVFYGKGNRVYVNSAYTFNHHFSFWFKLAYTKYADKQSVGNGLEAIDGNQKTDMKLMVRYKF